jgi:hypothetical protein
MTGARRLPLRSVRTPAGNINVPPNNHCDLDTLHAGISSGSIKACLHTSTHLNLLGVAKMIEDFRRQVMKKLASLEDSQEPIKQIEPELLGHVAGGGDVPKPVERGRMTAPHS